jgi:hypothetical protein
MEIIKEIKINGNNNENQVAKGVYKTENGFMWLTFTRSGNCKNLSTALRKAGF